MSRQLPGEQVEHAFNPKRLQNWETPREDDRGLQKTLGGSRFGTLKTPAGNTQAIVDEKGYLLPGVPKVKNSFNPAPPIYAKSSARWPVPNASYKHAPRSTMGYKGIQTDYLPTSTVATKTADIPGSKEFNYSFR